MTFAAGLSAALRTLLIACVAVLGFLLNTGSVSAADGIGVRAVTIHTYDTPHDDDRFDHAESERGPPAVYDHGTTYHAVDRWAHSPSARPAVATHPATYTYDHPAPLVQVASVASITVGWAVVTAGPPSPPEPSRVAAEDGTTLYRGMIGAAGGTPELGSSAKTLGARPGIDIPVDEGGMVRPGTGGMSVNDSPTGMPEFAGHLPSAALARTSTCTASARAIWVPAFAMCLMLEGTDSLEPAWEMPFEEYQGYLHGTAGSWSEVLP